MCPYSNDIEFEVLFMEMFVRSFDANCLNDGKANGPCFI